MVKRKLILILCLSLLCVNNIGCAKQKDYDTENKLIDETQESITEEEKNKKVKNVRDYSTAEYNSMVDMSELEEKKENLLPDNQVMNVSIGGETKSLTLREIAKLFDNTVKIETLDYRIKENLVFNYVIINEKKSTGVYLNESINEVRQDEQFYRDIQRITNEKNYYRDILALKYKNRKNLEYYIGTFSTKDKKKAVNIDWQETNTEEERTKLLTELRNFDFTGLTDFYYINNAKDYKAKGSMSLEQWLTFLTITNSGTKTLRNISAVTTRDVTEKGVTKEESITIKPMTLKFDYSLEVKDNHIIFKTLNLTETLKNYYKIFPQYEALNSEYTLDLTYLETKEEKKENENEENLSDIFDGVGNNKSTASNING